MTTRLRPDRQPGYEASPLTRRAFIQRTALAGAATAGIGYLAFAPENAPLSLKDATGARDIPPVAPFQLPSYRVAKPTRVPHDIGIARGTRRSGDSFTRDEKRALLKAALDAVGGIEHYVKPGETVLVKPNVAFDRWAILGATSDPEMVAELVRILLDDARALEVRIADNPIESPADCFRTTGIGPAAEAAGATVILPHERFIRTAHTPGATLLDNWPIFARPFEGADKVIGLCPVKDHVLTKASIGLKNWMGMLAGTRNRFHDQIHEVISDLALVVRPTLTIIDGTRVLARNGPTGGDVSNVDPGDVVLAALDPVAADAWAYRHCLKRDDDLPHYLHLAEQKGCGRLDTTGRTREVTI